jgi:hypothetical protein
MLPSLLVFVLLVHRLFVDARRIAFKTTLKDERPLRLNFQSSLFPISTNRTDGFDDDHPSQIV